MCISYGISDFHVNSGEVWETTINDLIVDWKYWLHISEHGRLNPKDINHRGYIPSVV